MGTRSRALSHIAELLGMFAPQGEMVLVSDGSLRFTPTVFLDMVDGGKGFPTRLCRSHTAVGGRQPPGLRSAPSQRQDRPPIGCKRPPVNHAEQL